MKIATYNVKSGGFSKYGQKTGKPERLNLIKEAVKKINADLIALVDTYKWDMIFTNKELQKIFGYKKSYLINLDDQRLKKLGHDNGITILTNFNNVRFEVIRLFNRNAIKSQVILKKKILNIYSVYLDDLSEETRFKEIKVLLEISKKERNKILMGDFNSIDRKDLPEVSKNMNTFILNNSNISAYFVPVFSGMKKGKVVQLLKKYKYADVFKKYFPTVLTKATHLNSKKPFMRLDYAFHSPDVKTKNARVLYDKIFDKASDHYPIAFEIDV